MDGVNLEFEQEALDYIVDKAVEFKLGARGLRSLTESIMTPHMYEVPSGHIEKLVITKQMAEDSIGRMEQKMLQ